MDQHEHSAERDHLAAVLDAILSREAPPDPRPGDSWQSAVAAFAAFERLDAALARQRAEEGLAALDPTTPAVVRVAAYAARMLAAAMSHEPGAWTDIAPGATPTGDPLADALPLLDELGTTAVDDFARYLLAESALTCARVGLAARLPLPRWDAFILGGPLPHPASALFAVLAARVAVFHGRVDDARAALDGVHAAHPRYSLLVEATTSVVTGNAADPRSTRRIAGAVAEMPVGAPSRVSVGCLLLAAYGLVALGDVRPSAELVLKAGGGPELPLLMTTDRAIAFEMLTHAALVDDDIDAAEAWASRSDALDGNLIAAASVARIRSRMLLAHGDPAGAEREAERAIALALAEGRGIEASEGEILRARAAIAARARGAADRHLQRLAVDAARTGHLAAVRAASHELRAAGRRLRPQSGSEWLGLSKREREVTHLLLEGLSNLEIAEVLFVSPHTVRAHVSRVFAAFGVASRFALAVKVPVLASAGVVAREELTVRQSQVVSEVASGAGNSEIAASLGISVKTVEKHIREVMRRIGVTSRVGILRYAIVTGAPANKP